MIMENSSIVSWAYAVQGTPLERWSKLGFTYGIEEKDREILLANTFEEILQRMQTEDNEDFADMAFPVTRRVIELLRDCQTEPSVIATTIFEHKDDALDMLDIVRSKTYFERCDKVAITISMFCGMVISTLYDKGIK